MPFRIMLFSPRALALEGQLSPHAAFRVVDAFWGEVDAFHLLMEQTPDMAVLDDALPGLNALHLCRRLAAHCAAPPRVLYLGPAFRQALEAGADEALAALPPSLADALHGLASHPLPCLAKPLDGLRQAAVEGLLSDLNMPPSLKGTAYLRYALPLLAAQPDPLLLLGKPLYAHIAQAFHTTPGAVERALRTAIEATWLSGSLAAISALFGYTVSPEKGKPTNNECLALLARHVLHITKNTLLQSHEERNEAHHAIPSHHAR